MRINNLLIRPGLAAGVALTMLAGCAASDLQQPTPPGQMQAEAPSAGDQGLQNLRFARGPIPRSGITAMRAKGKRSFMDPSAVGKSLIFLSDGDATVNIYLKSGEHKQVGWITGLSVPTDLATDAARNLYVSLGGGFSGTTELVVYAPPYTKKPTLTLALGEYPFGVAVSPQGVVAVTGCTSSSCGGLGVTFYALGSSVPCATVVTYPQMNPGYAAFDDKGNLYIDGNDASNNQVVGEIAGGCDATSMILLTTGNTIGLAAGVQVNQKGRIAILDASSSAAIYTYLPPQNGSLGNPVSTTPLTSSPSALAFTFLASGRSIWVADANGRASNYDYPNGGGSEQTIIGSGYPSGIAVTPPLVP